jgi:hypothetical protein
VPGTEYVEVLPHSLIIGFFSHAYNPTNRGSQRTHCCERIG